MKSNSSFIASKENLYDMHRIALNINNYFIDEIIKIHHCVIPKYKIKDSVLVERIYPDWVNNRIQKIIKERDAQIKLSIKKYCKDKNIQIIKFNDENSL